MRKRPARAPVQPDLDRPSAARVYDYLLGGVAHGAPDRELARRMVTAFPGLPDAVRLNRQFLQRVVRFLAQQGIRQFVDLGAGVPSHGGVHEIAQSVAPDARVVYVDVDSVAVAIGEQVLQDHKNTAFIEFDLREPESLLSTLDHEDLINPSEPIAILLVATPHQLRDADQPRALIERYHRLLAGGSYLAMSHPTQEDGSHATRLREMCPYELTFRSKDEIAELMGAFDLVEPGIVSAEQWRPEVAPEQIAHRSACYAAVGRKTNG